MTRIDPQLPPSDTVTYRIGVPDRCWRPATCDEVACPNYLLGWQTILSEDVPQQARLAYMIRRELKLRFTEEKDPAGLTTFTFPAGQTCFGAQRHRVRSDEPENFLVTGGDHRGNPRGDRRVHTRAADWVEDFNEHTEKIATAQSRGY